MIKVTLQEEKVKR